MVAEPVSARPALPPAMKVVVAYFILLFVAIIGMQTTTVIDYEFARSLGFQEDDPASADRFVAGRARLERATALADVIIQGLLGLGAIIGLLKRRGFGLACGFGLLAISVYWPTFDMFNEAVLGRTGFGEGLIPAHVIIESVIIVTALAAALTLYRHRRLFVN
ncbi:MAG: hypothetical protein JSU81_11225 [Candidatus Coatesbacteria bacterium]|nr:MAG: hypothetical protein JSU81_11225 [Candidatus Coatesbacteria bacterium]